MSYRYNSYNQTQKYIKDSNIPWYKKLVWGAFILCIALIFSFSDYGPNHDTTTFFFLCALFFLVIGVIMEIVSLFYYLLYDYKKDNKDKNDKKIQ
jgi:hypothetical protein